MRVFKLILMLLLTAISLAGCAKGVCVSPQCLAQVKYIIIAETGTAEDKYKLGSSYYMGQAPFEKNDVEAAKWFEEAATLGHAKAQYNLGITYDVGEGVRKDAAKAFIGFKKRQNKETLILNIIWGTGMMKAKA